MEFCLSCTPSDIFYNFLHWLVNKFSWITLPFLRHYHDLLCIIIYELLLDSQIFCDSKMEYCPLIWEVAGGMILMVGYHETHRSLHTQLELLWFTISCTVKSHHVLFQRRLWYFQFISNEDTDSHVLNHHFDWYISAVDICMTIHFSVYNQSFGTS